MTAHKFAALPGITREESSSNLAWARTVVHTPGTSNENLGRACEVAVRVLFG
ncbi:hypothetical protein OG230_35965 [Streptomyces sp. NBC_00234]|uniref:hypothetical protein n=1 Tax=Streptomyces sp. NBC_00234 TaxID=2903638 RepID=UPI002E2DED35|nr:hypothetical protein [Streptomyces sp. NBC_00234]